MLCWYCNNVLSIDDYNCYDCHNHGMMYLRYLAMESISPLYLNKINMLSFIPKNYKGVYLSIEFITDKIYFTILDRNEGWITKNIMLDYNKLSLEAIYNKIQTVIIFM